MKTSVFSTALCAIALSSTSTTASAVDRLVPQQYSTIQAAINASTNGDRVLIAPGTYNGPLTISGKSLSLSGPQYSSGPPQVHLVATGTVLTIQGNGTQTVSIDNLLIRDAMQGVYANNVDVFMAKCVLTNFNNPSGNGGCYRQNNRSLHATDCHFSMGRAAWGGGVYVGFGSCTLTRCTLDGNTAVNAGGAGFAQSGSSFRLDGCFLANQHIDIATNSFGYLTDCRMCESGVTAVASGASVIDEGGNIQSDECDDCDGQSGPDIVAIGLGVGDCDGDLVPDHCDEPCDPLFWSRAEGGNGHWYQRISRHSRTWDQCLEFARSIGAELASISSLTEQNAISSLIPTPVWGGYWNAVFLGGRQWESGHPDRGWSWSDGTPWSFTDWQQGQPDGGEGFLALYRLADGTNLVRWGDWPSTDSGVYFFLAEWSADCNGDGIVDYGQILSGQLADANNNGVPDSCEVDPCPGDITGNDLVDGVDLAAILGAWGTDGQNQYDCDIDGDGVVSGTDLAFVLGGWGPCQ